jgi:acyl dehydratase
MAKVEQVYFEDVNEGDAVSGWPEFGPVTRSHFVRYAGASGDFNPMHHDDTIAQKVGYPSVFGHGMFTAGLLSAYVTDWVGIGNTRKYGVEFRKQLFPGAMLRITGTVVRKYKEGDENRIDAEFEVKDDKDALILKAKATAALPSRG